MSGEIDLATVESSRFEPLLHHLFSARALEAPPEQAPVEFELVRVAPHSPGAQEGRRTPFSLFFNAPPAVPLTQGIFVLTHAQTGEMLLFLVPVGRKEDRIQMQAVLN